jgi:hypothetical protein
VLDHLEAADAESYSDCDIHLEVLVLDHLDYSDDNRSFTRESSDGKSTASPPSSCGGLFRWRQRLRPSPPC